MKISKNNRSIVNILGAPIIIFSIINSKISFIVLLSSIITFSFYEYFKLIKNKRYFTILNMLLGFFWISSIACLIPIYESLSYKFILVIFFAVWITDSFAFIMGRQFGKKKILPSVSRNKTWVGSISGLLSSMLFIFLIFHYYNIFPSEFTFLNILIIGFITGFFSQIGDFLESYFKRQLEVKDSSNLLLGHGGFLDRFDSLFIVSITMYMYLLINGFLV